MRILAFSDLHGEEYALGALKGKSSGFDQVFICGDVGDTNAFAEKVMHAFPEAFVVPGNGEDKHVLELLSKMPNYVHRKRIELDNGLNVVGFGHSNPTPFNTYGELPEDELYLQMSKLPIDSNTMLLLHAPPKGYFDAVGNGISAGSDSILRIIETKKPFAAFFGHIHEHAGMDRLGDTFLVKVPGAASMRAVDATIGNKRLSVSIITL